MGARFHQFFKTETNFVSKRNSKHCKSKFKHVISQLEHLRSVSFEFRKTHIQNTACESIQVNRNAVGKNKLKFMKAYKTHSFGTVSF